MAAANSDQVSNPAPSQSRVMGKLLIVAGTIVLIVAIVAGNANTNSLQDKLQSLFAGQRNSATTVEQKLLKEENVVIDVAEKVSPSVVTVSVELPERRFLQFSPFGGIQQRTQGGEPQDIGTGFIVDSEGLIVTNKHVVDQDGATYTVITQDDQEYEVQSISRDPSNDIAVIKINASGLPAVELGDSDSLKVGQSAIAIGTALGEFRHTVTTGVVSGLGRGITAGSAYEGFVERLDNVIQTDAAINPGNSGGPLINSAGQVIGVNVAVADGAQNIGFAIPINVVKEGLRQFKDNGQFASKPFLGVEYQMLPRQTALLNDVPQGAYIINVVDGSPASSAGLQPDDIITEFDGTKSDENSDLAELIASKKAGDSVQIKIWRNGEELSLQVNLSEFER